MLPRYPDLPENFYYERAIWVLGPTGSGKSTLAKKLQSQWLNDVEVLECGSFARALLPPEATVSELTGLTYGYLEKDAKFFSKKIAAALARTRLGKMMVVVGARNPIDFMDNFDTEKDSAIIIRGFEPKSEFEELGLKAIEAHLDFLKEVHIIAKRQVAYLTADDATR